MFRFGARNSSMLSKIVFSPPDDLGFGGGADDSGVQDDHFDDGDLGDSQEGYSGGFGQDDEINLEDDPDLKDFWNTGDDDNSSAETPEQRSERLRAEEQEMAAELQSGLESFAFSDDLIPEDFNPADPQQLRGVLASAVRQGAAMTMKLMFKPVNKAISVHNQNLRDYVERHTQSNDQNNRFESLLSRQIPAVNDPLSGPLIKQLAETQRKRYPNDPQAAIRAVVKGMKSMGMPIQNSRGSRNLPPGSQTGQNMLEGFFSDMTPPRRPQTRLKK